MTATIQNHIETALSDIKAEVLPINLDQTYTVIYEGEAFSDATLKQVTAFIEDVNELRIDDYVSTNMGLTFETSAFNYQTNDWEYHEDIIAYKSTKKMSDFLASYGVSA